MDSSRLLLTTSVIESGEYLSAVTAHSTYFSNGDFQDFFISLMAAGEVSTSNLMTARTVETVAQGT
jgi:hypothetical protein